MATKQTTRQEAPEVRAFWQLIGDLEPSEAEYIAEQVNADIATQALLDAVGDRVPPGRAVIAVEPYLEMVTDEAVDARRVTPMEVRAWAAGKLPIPGVVARVLLHRVLDYAINEGGDLQELPLGVVALSRAGEDEEVHLLPVKLEEYEREHERREAERRGAAPLPRLTLRPAPRDGWGPGYFDETGRRWRPNQTHVHEDCARCGNDIKHSFAVFAADDSGDLRCEECVSLIDGAEPLYP